MHSINSLLDIVSTAEMTRSTNTDKTGHFYHVTQQGYSVGTTFSVNSGKYRMNLLHSICARNRVIPLCNVIMPSHTHDVFYAEDFANIEKVMQALNTAVSKFIRTERKVNNRKFSGPVFADHPYYEKIESKEHLFFTFKYLYENPQYLKKDGKFVPYSCFDQWAKDYYKPYKEQVYKLLFNKELNEICSMCISLTKEQFRAEAQKLFGNEKLE